MAEQSERRYHWMQIALHWFVVALLLSQYVTSGAIARTHHAEDPARIDLIMHALHNRVGVLIFALMLTRLIIRVFSGRRKSASYAKTLTERAAGFTHGALYAVVLAQAATGAITSYLWWPMGAVHRGLWVVLLTLITLHVAAALWHHLVERDQTLTRMLPGLGKSR
jgi:cytochrome b561